MKMMTLLETITVEIFLVLCEARVVLGDGRFSGIIWADKPKS